MGAARRPLKRGGASTYTGESEVELPLLIVDS